MSNCVSPYMSKISFPKREELSFLMVLELPNASRISLQPSILSYMPASLESFLIVLALFSDSILDKDLSRMMVPMFLPREAKNFRQYFVFSVFPAPDYPLITID